MIHPPTHSCPLPPSLPCAHTCDAQLIFKATSYLCLYMPWMKRTRKRNEKLQRTLAKRRAEVRRMTEGGQEFVVKRAAKAKGKEDVAQTALKELTMKNLHKNTDGTKEKKMEVGGKLLAKMKKDEPAAESFKGTPAEGSGVGQQPLAIQNQAAPAPAPASSTAVVSAGTSGEGEGFAQDLRKLSAAAEAEEAAEDAAKEQQRQDAKKSE